MLQASLSPPLLRAVSLPHSEPSLFYPRSSSLLRLSPQRVCLFFIRSGSPRTRPPARPSSFQRLRSLFTSFVHSLIATCIYTVPTRYNSPGYRRRYFPVSSSCSRARFRADYHLFAQTCTSHLRSSLSALERKG